MNYPAYSEFLASNAVCNLISPDAPEPISRIAHVRTLVSHSRLLPQLPDCDEELLFLLISRGGIVAGNVIADGLQLG